MGSLFGGGGGSSVPAPTVATQPQAGTAQFYTPQAQPQADLNYNNTLYGLLGDYTSGSTPPQQTYPEAKQLADWIASFGQPGGDVWSAAHDIVNNPYNSLAQSWASDAANYENQHIYDWRAALDKAASAGSDVYHLGESLLGNVPSFSDISKNTVSLGSNVPAYAAATAGLAPKVSGLADQAATGIAPTQALAGENAALSNAVASYMAPTQGLAQTNAGLANTIAGGISPTQGLASTIAGTLPRYQSMISGVGQDRRAIEALAARPEGINKLQGASADLLNLGKTLSAQPAGGGKLMTAGTNLLNAGYDPRRELYNRTLSQTADQSAALNSLSGLASSPYGAGVTSDALRNFNIDWQNQQLQRQAEALSGAGSAFTTASGLRQGRENLLSNAISGAATGYGTAGSLLSNKAGLYNTSAGLEALKSQILSAEGGQAATAGGLYNTAADIGTKAGGLNTSAGGLYNTAAGIGATAGGLNTSAGGLYNTAAGIANTAGGLNTAAGGLYNSATNQLGTGANINTAGANQLLAGGNYAGGLSTILNSLQGNASAGIQNLSDLSKLEAGAGSLPGDVYNQQAQQKLQAFLSELSASNQGIPALTGATNMGTSQYALPETLLSDLSNYLKLGQNASVSGGELGQIGTQNQPNTLADIGSLLSGGGLGGALFGSGGIGSALGIPSSGLLGSLLGTGSSGGGGAGGLLSLLGLGGSGGGGFIPSLAALGPI